MSTSFFKNFELKELKERKKKKLEAKKHNQIEMRKRKHEHKLERQIIKERKQEEREKQLKQRKLKKKERQDWRKGKLSKMTVNKGPGLFAGEGSTPLTSLPKHYWQQSTPTTPLTEHHQILRDMYNILTPTYVSLHNIQAMASHSPPHSPIKQLQFSRLLDENIFGHSTPITPHLDSSSPNNPTRDSPMEVPKPFPTFMVN